MDKLLDWVVTHDLRVVNTTTQQAYGPYETAYIANFIRDHADWL